MAGLGVSIGVQVIGAAREGLGRVGDYYTRDRSTPRLDKDYVRGIVL